MLRGFDALLTYAAVATSPWLAGAIRATGDAADSSGNRGEAAAVATGGRAVRVTLLLTRHAFSCANVANQFGYDWVSRSAHAAIPDPMISECGTAASQSAGEELEKQGIQPDLVLSSSLTRAMETAMLMFPHRVVTPVPYISEKGMGLDNTPKDVKAQLEMLQQLWPHERFRGGLWLDMRWMKHEAFAQNPRWQPDFQHFLRFMENQLLPELPEGLREKEQLTIAVVTHSNFLAAVPTVSQLCKSFYKNKPQNNQVLELSFNFEASLVFKDEQTRAVLAEVAVDPHTHDPGAAWEQLRAAMDGGAYMKALPSLLMRLPPWRDQGLVTEFRRSLTLAPGTVCRNIYAGQAEPAYVCRADVGKACELAFQELGFGRPSIMTWEDHLRKANNQRGEPGGLQALREFRCCVPPKA